MSWNKDNGKLAKASAEEALVEANRAKAQADYIDTKKPLIDKFTGEQTNLQTQINNLVLQKGTDIAEVVQARGGEATLNERFNKTTAQLADTSTQVIEGKRALNYYWLPPIQPHARKDHEGYFTDAFNMKFQDYIDGLFEPIRLANPKYVTRSSLGKDTSGLYDVWKYEFTPVNYEKTIIISSSLHGSEVTLTVTMARFLHYLINEYEKYPELAYIREKVKIVFVPFANPWGTSQAPRTRYNSNGVDLNRNFDYKWADYVGAAPFGHDYKGTSPFSEVETRYMRDLILSYPDAIAHLDLHNTGPSTRHYFVYMPENYKPKTYEQLAAYFTRNISSPDILLNRNPSPSLSNYRYHINGIPSAHPEWCDNMSGGSQYGSEEMTKSLEWLANVIIEHCREFGNVKGSGNGTGNNYSDVKVEANVNVRNFVTNGNFANGKTGWTATGTSNSTSPTADNVYTLVGSGGSNTPSVYGGISVSEPLPIGAKFFVKAKVKCPVGCTKVELKMRDFSSNVNLVIATISNPTPDTFIEIKGNYEMTSLVTAPNFQFMFSFPSTAAATNAQMQVKEVFALNLKTIIPDYTVSQDELNFIFAQTSEWFDGTKSVVFLKQAAKVETYEKDLMLILFKKIKDLEARLIV